MPTLEEWHKARDSAKYVSLLTGKTHDMGWVYDLTEEEFTEYKANRRTLVKEKK